MIMPPPKLGAIPSKRCDVRRDRILSSRVVRMSEVHAQARTTPRTRAEIKASTESVAKLAERYDLSRATARKWKHRDSTEDRSHRPHKLHTTPTPAQEVIVVELRCMALLPLDDLVAVVREFIHPDVSRADLDLCLRLLVWQTCANSKPRRWPMRVKPNPQSRPSKTTNQLSYT